jgi:hypothetical protein
LRDNETQASGASRREKADAYLVFELNYKSRSVIARSALVRRSPPSGEGGCDEAIHLTTGAAVKWIASLVLAMTADGSVCRSVHVNTPQRRFSGLPNR